VNAPKNAEAVNMLQEIAKHVGRPIQTGCKLIENVLSVPSKRLGDLLGEQISYWQWSNRLAFAEKAAQKLKQRGIPVRSLPADFAIPLLRECGDAEDPNLQEWWAELLASSVADESLCHVAFVHTLQSMSPADVKFLDALLQIGPGDPKKKWGLFKQATGFSADQINICVHVLDKLGFFMVGSEFRLRGFAFDFLRTCCAQTDRIAAYKEKQSKLSVKLLLT
jgi:hypothetical protein